MLEPVLYPLPSVKAVTRTEAVRMVLQTLRANKRLSRTDLGRLLQVSPATISHWVQELMDRNFVEEDGLRGSRLGRPTTYLRVRCDCGYAIVADVMHDGITIAVIDFCGEILEVRKIECEMEEYHRGTELLSDCLHDAITSIGIERVIGISLIFPGIWDHSRRHLVFSSSLPKWIGMDLTSHFFSEYGVPIFIENDANAAAVGQIWFGGMQPIDDALIILIRWGMGSAVVRAREVIRGTQSTVTGLGHMVVNFAEDAPTCRCGNQGCIEAVLARSIQSLRSPRGNWEDSLHLIAKVLGVGSANLVNLLGLKSVIVINQSWEFFDALWPDWVQEMRSRIMPHLLHQVSFQTSLLNENATLLGGAWTVFNEFISTFEQQEVLNL